MDALTVRVIFQSNQRIKSFFPYKDKLNRSQSHASAIADHVTSTGHHLKWDNFDILARGRSDIHCKIKETLLMRDLKPALNENVGSKKLYLY